MDMLKKCVLLLALILSLSFVLVTFAQYTGADLERKKPENLYPEPGPGDLLIVDQLRETNRLLQEQTRLLTEQNRILLNALEQAKKSNQPPATPRP
jgi:hypothetical protein